MLPYEPTNERLTVLLDLDTSSLLPCSRNFNPDTHIYIYLPTEFVGEVVGYLDISGYY